jgi:hypothetical protein
MLPQSQKREHPAGAALLGAIGIVTRQVASRADPGIVDRAHAEIPALPDDVGGKIDFVMRWSNTRTQLDNQVGWTRPELISHRLNRVRDHAEFGAFLAGMDESDRATNGIDEINRTAIGNVYAETDPMLISDDPIAIGETFVRRDRHVHNGNLFPMDLLRGDERSRAQLMFGANFSMNTVESCERFGLVVRHLDAGNTERETVDHLRQRAQRREMFDRKLSFAHLLPVVRVVRVVVVVVRTGGRLPA